MVLTITKNLPLLVNIFQFKYQWLRKLKRKML